MEVTCDVTTSEAIVEIQDHGEGIPGEFLPFVFERFRQADGSRTRAFGGLGLGLALVKNFMTSHLGTIEAKSAGNGEGSVFVITLPLEVSTVEVSTGAQTAAGAENEKRTRVLLVEDEPDTLEMLAAHFRTRGIETSCCGSAAEALLVADRESFDIVISDIAMPEMDGLQLIRELRRTTPSPDSSGNCLNRLRVAKRCQRGTRSRF